MSTVTAWLLVALALSAAGNLGLTHLYLGKRDELASSKAVSDQVSVAAQACTDGVSAMKRESDERAKLVSAALDANRKAVVSLQMAAAKALVVTPDDPTDLCGSLDQYLRRELAKERAVK